MKLFVFFPCFFDFEGFYFSSSEEEKEEEEEEEEDRSRVFNFREGRASRRASLHFLPFFK